MLDLMALNQVQAYHMDTKIDPMHPVRWLERVDGALVIPSDSHHVLTRILQPFEAQLSDLHLMMLAQVPPLKTGAHLIHEFHRLAIQDVLQKN